jgi:hypothetical protein
MDKRTYISNDELNRFLNYLKVNKRWGYYVIIYNITKTGKSFTELKKINFIDIEIPKDVPIQDKNPFNITIRSFNQFLNLHGALSGLREIHFSTKLFLNKFMFKGNIYYGTMEKDRKSYKMMPNEGYLYIVKHVHRNPDVSKLLTDKKVGFSSNYLKRIEGLTLGTVGIELIKYWKMSMVMVKFIEKEIHNKLKDRQIIGEWFSDDDNQLVDMVSNIISSYTPSEC